MPAPDLRTQIELMQPLPNYRGFTKTTTDANATTVIDVAAVMEEANRITFVVELGDLYINFNGRRFGKVYGNCGINCCWKGSIWCLPFER